MNHFIVYKWQIINQVLIINISKNSMFKEEKNTYFKIWLEINTIPGKKMLNIFCYIHKLIFIAINFHFDSFHKRALWVGF